MKNHKALVDSLSAFEPGKLPLNVFSEIARLTVTPVVEVVPFYVDKGNELKVFLLQRGVDDDFWPGKYHVPGSIVVASDKAGSFEDSINRVIAGALSQYKPEGTVFIEAQLRKVKRGMETALIYKTNLTLPPKEDSLFKPLNLPQNMIEGHEAFIHAAYRTI